jgi:predicted AlkP superfamily pyrophosphatase or phosphodiesterase
LTGAGAILAVALLLLGASAAARAATVVLISIDGMRPDYVTQAAQHGLHIPHLTQFMTEGVYADGVIPVVPSVTFPNHTTMITGVMPSEHGIYTNQLFDPMHTDPIGAYLYASQVRVPTLWEAAAKSGILVASVGWPVSVGAKGVSYLIPEYAGKAGNGRPSIEDLSKPAGWIAQEGNTLGPLGHSGGNAVDGDLVRTKYAVEILRTKKPGFMTIHLGALDEEEHATSPFSKQSDEALEAIDQMVGQIEDAAFASDPAATIMVVSDHGFARTDYDVNLELLFSQAGLIRLKDGDKGPVVESWDAELWRASGCAAVMLRDSHDAALYAKVKALLAKLEAEPSYGIDRVIEQPEIRKMGAFPEASFLIEMKPDYEPGYSLSGDVVVPLPSHGTHGYLSDRPEMRASFFVKGKGIPAGRDLGTIEMRRIAPTVAALLGIAFPSAQEPSLPLAP